MTTLSEPSSASGRGPRLVLAIAILVAVGVAALGMIGRTGPSNGHPSPAADPSMRPTPSLADVEPYDAIFAGDATGNTDVTADLQVFLQSHDGQRVALARDGIYKVRQLTVTAKNLTVDFRGSRIEADKAGVYGILVIRSSSNLILNDPYIVGTGYQWVGGEANPQQWEHGIEIEGGSNLVINDPTTRNTLGDGIYIGFESGRSTPPTGVVINEPNVEHASRNGIAPVAGEVTINGGHIAYVGLHGIDFEPNNDVGAMSLVGLVQGVDIRHIQDLDVAGLTGYAIAAAGPTKAATHSITVTNVTGDHLRMLIPNTAVVVVRNNVSDTQAVADFEDSGSVVFADNIRITRK